MNVLTIAPSSSPAATQKWPVFRRRARPCRLRRSVTAGRGVLDGAFAVLDALAHADEGLGLTALARVSGLAKASAHRLVATRHTGRGAVRRAPLLCRAADVAHGQRWQPDPLLRLSAQAPVHAFRAVARHGVAADPA